MESKQTSALALYWHRNDLRLHDNAVLTWAARRKIRILPVYVIPESWTQESRFGFPRVGRLRHRFIGQALAGLASQYQRSGSGLLVVQGPPERVLPELVSRTEAASVVCTGSWISEERNEEHRLALNLDPSTEFVRLSQGTLIAEQDLPFVPENMPDVFSDFRRAVERSLSVRQPDQFGLPEFASLPTNPPSVALPYATEGTSSVDPRTAFPFTGDEAAALARVEYYFSESRNVLKYKETRNQMVGHDYSTKFSPWLATGALSPRMVYHRLKAAESRYGANESTYWVFFELLWRDYFAFLFKKYGTRLFQTDGLASAPQSRYDPTVIQSWTNGRCGNAFIDANMRELAATGFMSNRGRQNVASYFVHVLRQPWLAGAEWFEATLLDYDPASNYGNWAYLAGVGTDPRAGRVFNADKQAEQYDPSGAFRDLWLGPDWRSASRSGKRTDNVQRNGYWNVAASKANS